MGAAVGAAVGSAAVGSEVGIAVVGAPVGVRGTESGSANLDTVQHCGHAGTREVRLGLQTRLGGGAPNRVESSMESRAVRL